MDSRPAAATPAAAASAPARAGRAARLLTHPAAIVAAAAAVRLAGLDRLSLWQDEAWTIPYSRQAPAALLAFGPEQVYHPPLYYLALHYWLLLGNSAVGARLYSALWGIAAVAALYALARTLGGPRLAVAAGWLLALDPWAVWYAQEARMYAMVTALAVIACAAGARWIVRPRAGWALLYVAAAVAALYTNYTAFLIWPLAAAVLWAAVGRGAGRGPAATPRRGDPPAAGARGARGAGRGRALGWIALQGVVAVAYLPQAVALPAVAAGLAGPGSLVTAELGAFGWSLGAAAAAAGGAALIAGGAAAWVWRRPPGVRRRLVAGALLLAWAGAVAVQVVPGMSLPKRQLSILAPFLCLGAAWAVTAVAWPRVRWPTLAVGAALALAAMIAFVPKEPWREAVAAIEAGAQPGDLVLIEPSWQTTSFAYYDGGRLGSTGLGPGGLTPALAARLGARSRFWLIVAAPEQIDPDGAVARWMAARYRPVSTWRGYHVDVTLYAGGGP